MNPIDNQIVNTNQPTLWVQNSTDAESDSLVYDYVIAIDTTFGEPDPILGYGISEQTDSTGWQVAEPLTENYRYWWNARAYDGYEYSDWSEPMLGEVWINVYEEAPTAFLCFDGLDIQFDASSCARRLNQSTCRWELCTLLFIEGWIRDDRYTASPSIGDRSQNL